MKTFRVYIRRPSTKEPIWDFSTTVVASSESAALDYAYDEWLKENPQPTPPGKGLCQFMIKLAVSVNQEVDDTVAFDPHQLPTDAVQGMSKGDAESLEKNLGIKTMGDLAEHPLTKDTMLSLESDSNQQSLKTDEEMKQVVLLDEMVSDYRSSRRHDFRPRFIATVKDKSADDLFSLVQESKKAPASTTIAVVDTKGPESSGGHPTQDALGIYNDMLTLSSLANVVSMKNVYDNHPVKYDITVPKQASAFIKSQAVNLHDTFTRRLGAYALPGETTSQHFNKEVTSADLHLEFLNTLFSSFALPPKAMLKLDGILTQVKDSLANLKVGLETEEQTLDHLIFVNYIDAIDIAGVPEKVLSGKIRMFYLKIDQSSWKASVGKSSVSKVGFTMDYFDTIFSINSNLVRSDTSTITELIQKFTGHSFDDIRKLTSPKAIKK